MEEKKETKEKNDLKYLKHKVRIMESELLLK